MEQVGEEVLQIRSALDKYSSREQRRQREAQERDELMAGAAEGRRLAREMDEEAALMGSSQRANQQLNELYETGANILSTMAGSRERLKVGAPQQWAALQRAQQAVQAMPSASQNTGRCGAARVLLQRRAGSFRWAACL